MKEVDEKMRKIIFGKNIGMAIAIGLLLSTVVIVFPSEKVNAGTYNGEDLALAILANQSTLISSTYTDTDPSGYRQSAVLSSLGIMSPTDGSTFALFSTGIAGNTPSTTNENNPGDERGSWFAGGKNGYPRDEATLTMILQVPAYMHYLYYDVQFFSSEYPEWIGTIYNDKLTVTVDSPSEGTSEYIFDINSGYFVLDSNGIPGTGFDLFAQSGSPGGVDWVDTTPRTPGADAGASDLVPIGGVSHPVSPHEQITVTINIHDTGDNILDSSAFIDNLEFSGYAKTELVARKLAYDLNGDDLECGDRIKYEIRISNTGSSDQNNNPGNEFEDNIPENTTYAGSPTANYGTISYDAGENKIIWNGQIPATSTCILTFDVTVDSDLENGALISNQGTVYWDSNEDGTNDATELTDDYQVDDGIDQDGDGDTDDDDPILLYVIAFESPSTVTEDFSDDTTGGKATQSYLDREWFETDEGVMGSIFKIVSGYHYLTDKSFKTKLRSSGSPQYWHYNMSNLESNVEWWEICFKCGNASEASDLYLNFKNSAGNDIAKIKFEYVQMGTEPPTDWVLELNYWNPTNGWNRLNSDYPSGYLYNSWYKLRIENCQNYIIYSLNRTGTGMVDSKTGDHLSTPFSDLADIEWINTKLPIVCPMFFWDEHKLGLINE
jgi:uncharacterized repeat protein (TIGR01451 family)